MTDPPLAVHKVASIVPTAHLKLIKDDQFFMALVHVVLHSSEYSIFYKDQVAAGKFVILDNSTVELGHPMDTVEYLEMAMYMNASQIVSPDWLYDAVRTLDDMNTFLTSVERHHYSGSVMAVPQGESAAEWHACAQLMIADPRVTCLGISRRYEQFNGDRRRAAVEDLYSLCQAAGRQDIKVHLLGCQGQPEVDAFPSIGLSFVQGVDSSLPAKFSMNGLKLLPGASKPPGAIDFDHQYNSWLIRDNIGRFKNLCAYGQLP